MDHNDDENGEKKGCELRWETRRRRRRLLITPESFLIRFGYKFFALFNFGRPSIDGLRKSCL